MTTKTRLIAFAILLRFGPYTSAATLKLKPETVAAWDAYLQAANDKMQKRLQPGANVLWIDEEPYRAQKIRTKGYIAPMVKGPYRLRTIRLQRKLSQENFAFGVVSEDSRVVGCRDLDDYCLCAVLDAVRSVAVASSLC